MAEISNLSYIRGSYEYEGIRYGTVTLSSSLEALPTFEVRADDTWIVTYPKAGTHWMLEIVGLILADGYPDKIDRSSSSTLIEMIDLDQKLPNTKEEEEKNPADMTPFMEKIERAPSPRVIQTHLRRKYLPKDALEKAKVIYLARNPKDCVRSWYDFSKEWPSSYVFTWEHALKDFMTGNQLYGPWSDHIKEFWDIRQDEHLLFLFYEDILRDPVKHVQMVADFIGRPLSTEALQRVVQNSSMTGMKKTYEKKAKKNKERGAELLRLNFVSKGKKGRWKNYFTVAENEAFDEWYRKEMAGSDVEVPFE